MLLKVSLGFFTPLCLFWTTFGVNYGPSDVKVFVKEGSDAILKCSLGNQDLRSDRFQWTKEDSNGSKRAFRYVQGIYSDNGLNDQEPQFKGRVSHFGDELQHGNASIKIHNTTVEDSGNYTCYFDRYEKTFYVELVVDAASLSHIKLSDATLLRCDVQGTSRSECQCSVQLLSTVNQTDHCCCVVTDGSEIPWWGWLICASVVLVVGVLVTVAAQKIFARCRSGDYRSEPVPTAENPGTDLQLALSSVTC